MSRIVKRYLTVAAVSLVIICSATTVMATPSLSYTATDLGNGNWSYNYTITNDLVGQSIDSFSVAFAYGLYSALQLDANPAGWGQSLVVDPIFTSTGPNSGSLFGFADQGFEIAPGTSLSGFSVSFVWGLLDTDANGNLLNPPIDSLSGILADGDQVFSYTTIPDSSPVPEPATLLLLGIGLAGLSGYRKIFRTRVPT